jgi:hypothetical protein
LFTLSAVSGYRLADWFSMFGFSLEAIPGFQLGLAPKRTTLLDATRYESAPEFSFLDPSSSHPVGPLIAYLRTLEVRSAPAGNAPYLYARIGREDAFAYPDLVPGSVVRADPRSPEMRLPSAIGSPSDSIFLIEHPLAVACCRLLRLDRTRFALCSLELPYPQIPFTPGHDGSLLGVVDLELRRVDGRGQMNPPDIPAELSPWELHQHSGERESSTRWGSWIRAARIRAGLRLREASLRSAQIAGFVRDPRYFIARSSLSHYETSDRPPRHVHKVLSLCALYGVKLLDFLEQLKLPLALLGRDPFPRPVSGAAKSLRLSGPPLSSAHSLSLPQLARSSDVPPFLEKVLSEVTGLPSVSIHDLFWVGGSVGSFRSRLGQPLFAVVDRRKKRPHQANRRSGFAQTIFVLLRRDGMFLCGPATLRDGNLVLHSFADGLSKPLIFRNRVDAEVVGQVAGLVHRIT